MYCIAHLGKDKRCVMFEEDLARADGIDRGRTATEGTLAGFLRCGIHSLPATVTRRKVWSRHPAVIPYMEVPRSYIN